MALQQSVGFMPARGLPGNPVNPSEVVHLHYNPLSDGTVEAGKFCFAVAVEGEGEKFGFASGKGQAGQYPLGIAVRWLVGHTLCVTDEATTTYFKGQHVTVAKRGQFYFAMPEGKVAKNGDDVYVNPTTGEVAFAEAEGFVDTGWQVVAINGQDYAEGDEIIVIENWG